MTGAPRCHWGKKRIVRGSYVWSFISPPSQSNVNFVDNKQGHLLGDTFRVFWTRTKEFRCLQKNPRGNLVERLKETLYWNLKFRIIQKVCVQGKPLFLAHSSPSTSSSCKEKFLPLKKVSPNIVSARNRNRDRGSGNNKHLDFEIKDHTTQYFFDCTLWMYLLVTLVH